MKTIHQIQLTLAVLACMLVVAVVTQNGWLGGLAGAIMLPVISVYESEIRRKQK